MWRGSSKDSFYLFLFITMVVHHYYSSHIALTLAPGMASHKNDMEVTFLPPFQTHNTIRDDTSPIPLDQLTTSDRTSCSSGLIYMPNRILPSTFQNETKTKASKDSWSRRKIPKIVHMTSKSRCFTPNFVTNIKKWEFPDHDLYIHDDNAVERLLSKHWSNFPHLPLARKCLRSGAGLADLWRYLVLWEYGGIYTDIDNAPGTFWTADTIQQDDDAFFVIENLGVLSQYFMAVSPKHPLMYLTVHQSLLRLLAIHHVGKQNIPVVTGPGALKVAFKYFMRTQEILSDEEHRVWKHNNPNGTRYGRVNAGKYYGVGDRSVTIAGTKETSFRLVIRGSVDSKIEGYQKMGMKHFSHIAKKKFNESCLVHLWNLEFEFLNGGTFNFTNW